MKYTIFLYIPLMCMLSCASPDQNTAIKPDKVTAVDSIMSSDSILCNLNLLVRTEKNLENINRIQTELFLRSLNTECKNSAEFTEYSNEILFKLLQKKPQIFLTAFCEAKELDKEYIILQIENPILDFNIDTIIIGINKANYSCREVRQIIKSLEKAKENVSDN